VPLSKARSGFYHEAFNPLNALPVCCAVATHVHQIKITCSSKRVLYLSYSVRGERVFIFDLVPLPTKRVPWLGVCVSEINTSASTKDVVALAWNPKYSLSEQKFALQRLNEVPVLIVEGVAGAGQN